MSVRKTWSARLLRGNGGGNSGGNGGTGDGQTDDLLNPVQAGEGVSSGDDSASSAGGDDAISTESTQTQVDTMGLISAVGSAFADTLSVNPFAIDPNQAKITIAFVCVLIFFLVVGSVCFYRWQNFDQKLFDDEFKGSKVSERMEGLIADDNVDTVKTPVRTYGYYQASCRPKWLNYTMSLNLTRLLMRIHHANSREVLSEYSRVKCSTSD